MNKLTLQQATDYLSENGLRAFSLQTLRSAVRGGRLPAELVTNTPVPYYVVRTADLVKWATSDAAHKPGKKSGKD